MRNGTGSSADLYPILLINTVRYLVRHQFALFFCTAVLQDISPWTRAELGKKVGYLKKLVFVCELVILLNDLFVSKTLVLSLWGEYIYFYVRNEMFVFESIILFWKKGWCILLISKVSQIRITLKRAQIHRFLNTRCITFNSLPSVPHGSIIFKKLCESGTTFDWKKEIGWKLSTKLILSAFPRLREQIPCFRDIYLL